MSGTRLTLFSDFTCPFSYVTEAALTAVTSEAGFVVAYGAYELFPAPAPLPPPPDPAEWAEPLRPSAEELALSLRPPGFRPRTRKAHEAARFARERGGEGPLRLAIYREFWGGGRDIGRIDVLCDIAQGIGFDAEDLRIALDIDVFADAVVADRSLADDLGIRHTPTLIVGEGAAASVIAGALSTAELRELLEL